MPARSRSAAEGSQWCTAEPAGSRRTAGGGCVCQSRLGYATKLVMQCIESFSPCSLSLKGCLFCWPGDLCSVPSCQLIATPSAALAVSMAHGPDNARVWRRKRGRETQPAKQIWVVV
jgi:hypothetical protein